MSKIVIETVLQAKAFILTLKQRIDAQTRSAAIKLTSHEQSLLNKSKTVLQQAGQYAETDSGRYLSIVQSRMNGLFMIQWLPVADTGTDSNLSTEAMFEEMVKSLADGKEITAADDELSLDNV